MPVLLLQTKRVEQSKNNNDNDINNNKKNLYKQKSSMKSEGEEQK